MVRGSYAHRVLELTYAAPARADRRRGASRRRTCAEAERILLEALDELRGEFPLSPNQTRVRAAVRQLEFDLLRYLRREAERDARFEPEHLELRSASTTPSRPAVRLDGRHAVRGMIDRVDTWDGHALVRDYKSGKVERLQGGQTGTTSTASRRRSTCSS